MPVGYWRIDRIANMSLGELMKIENDRQPPIEEVRLSPKARGWEQLHSTA